MVTMASFEHLTDGLARVTPVLLDSTLKGSAVLAIAWLAASGMRRSSSAARHMVWFATLASLLVLPLLGRALPAWRILPESWDVRKAVVVQRTVEAPQIEPVRGLPVSPSDAVAMPSDQMKPPALPLAPPADTPAGKPLSTWAWVGLAWLAGAGLLGLRLLAGMASLLWASWRLQTCTDEGWRAALLQTCSDLRIGRRVRLLEGPGSAMPMTWGLFVPHLLVPGTASEWTPPRRRVVLLHELAHVKRWDCLTQLLAEVACAIQWFNPLAWLASKQMQNEAERACDDQVIARGSQPGEYAEHLLQIAASQHQGYLAAAMAAIPMARPSRLEGRLLAILDGQRSRRAMTLGAFVLAIALVAGLVVPVAMLRGADKASAASQPDRQKARSFGKRATSANNIGMLGRGIHVYMGEFKRWPDDLRDLVEKGLKKPYDESADYLVNAERPQMRPGYVYVKPPPLERVDNPGREVVFYEAFDDWGGGINVGFVDGHVTFISDQEEFGKLLGREYQKQMERYQGRWRDFLSSRSSPSSAPATNLEASHGDHVVEPGDMLQVTISELLAAGTETVLVRQVNESGYVSIPLLGSIKLAGMTPREAETHIANLVQPIINRRPHVSVVRKASVATTGWHAELDQKNMDLGAPSSSPAAELPTPISAPATQPEGEFYVLGTARSGVFSLTGRKISLTQGVAAAGGLKPDSKVVQLLRPGKDGVLGVVATYSVEDAPWRDSPILQPEDVVYVSENPLGATQTVEVSGDVQRPGMFSLPALGTLLKVLVAAGLDSADADHARATILRSDPRGFTGPVGVFAVGRILRGEIPDPPLQPSDKIQVTVSKPNAPSASSRPAASGSRTQPDVDVESMRIQSGGGEDIANEAQNILDALFGKRSPVLDAKGSPTIYITGSREQRQIAVQVIRKLEQIAAGHADYEPFGVQASNGTEFRLVPMRRNDGDEIARRAQRMLDAIYGKQSPIVEAHDGYLSITGRTEYLDKALEILRKLETDVPPDGEGPATQPGQSTVRDRRGVKIESAASRPAAAKPETVTFDELVIGKQRPLPMRTVQTQPTGSQPVGAGPVGEFYVMGTPRPGAFSLSGRAVSLAQGLAAAGGLKPESRFVQLWRPDSQGQIETVFVYPVKKMPWPEAPLLQPGDVIHVSEESPVGTAGTLAKAKGKLAALKAQYETYRKMPIDTIPLTPEILAAVEADPQIAELEKRRTRLIEARQARAERFGEQHESLGDYDKRIQAAQKEASARRFEKTIEQRRALLERVRLDMIAAEAAVEQLERGGNDGEPN